MSVLTVTKKSLTNGIWEGEVSDVPEGVTPGIDVRLNERKRDDITLTPVGDGTWSLRIPIPPEAINDGIQTFLIHEAATGDQLAHFAILSGEVLADTMRAEMDLLRAELDLLKRDFRRHCVETA